MDIFETIPSVSAFVVLSLTLINLSRCRSNGRLFRRHRESLEGLGSFRDPGVLHTQPGTYPRAALRKAAGVVDNVSEISFVIYAQPSKSCKTPSSRLARVLINSISGAFLTWLCESERLGVSSGH